MNHHFRWLSTRMRIQSNLSNSKYTLYVFGVMVSALENYQSNWIVFLGFGVNIKKPLNHHLVQSTLYIYIYTVYHNIYTICAYSKINALKYLLHQISFSTLLEFTTFLFLNKLNDSTSPWTSRTLPVPVMSSGFCPQRSYHSRPPNSFCRGGANFQSDPSNQDRPQKDFQCPGLPPPIK